MLGQNSATSGRTTTPQSGPHILPPYRDRKNGVTCQQPPLPTEHIGDQFRLLHLLAMGRGKNTELLQSFTLLLDIIVSISQSKKFKKMTYDTYWHLMVAYPHIKVQNLSTSFFQKLMMGLHLDNYLCFPSDSWHPRGRAADVWGCWLRPLGQ